MPQEPINSDTQPSKPVIVAPPLRNALPRIVLRLGILAVVALLLNAFLNWMTTEIGTLNSIANQPMLYGILAAALLGYALLIALPFVPGIEIGVALLLLQGAWLAPFVWLATMTGLFVAYLLGQLVPLDWLQNAFRDLHMIRACKLLQSIKDTPARDRLAAMQLRLPRILGVMAADYRYLAIALLLNLPGSFLVGGGGGIMMFAGIIRLFRPGWIALTVALATLPVPLAVWLTGQVNFT